MFRVGALIFMSLLVSGCITDRSTRVPLAVNAQAVAQMAGTGSILQKRRIASSSCRRAGYVLRSDGHRQCMTALIARDLQRTRDRAERLVHLSAQRHGVCMQRTTFEIGRCIEI